MARAQAPAKPALATFAGGCFWCVEEAFDPVPGVISTTSGYMGGKKRNPSYEEVSAGVTGHTEVVQVAYDPAKVSYEKLLEVFWRNIDPTVKDRQFCDSGSQYRSEIFVHDDAQRKAAEAGEVVGDAAITSAVKTKFLADPNVSGLKIDVDTANGVVTLTGNVPNATEKTRALELARETTGVKSVTDRLKIVP